MLISKVLEDWGEDGFSSHIESVQAFYRQQRDALVECAERHLTGVCVEGLDLVLRAMEELTVKIYYVFYFCLVLLSILI